LPTLNLEILQGCRAHLVRLALALAMPSLAQAQVVESAAVESPSEAVHVRLVFDGDASPQLREDIAGDLRASLRERGIAMNSGHSEDLTALATVRIDVAEYATGRLRIIVEDALTRKLVERSLHLEQEPPDVWSVLVAAAADELLRASWIELSMPDAPAPALEVPAVVEEAIEASIGPRSRTDGAWGLGADASFVFSEGASFLGARLTLTQASLAPFTLTLGLGAAALLPVTSKRARFDGVWLFADLEAGIALLPRDGSVRLSVVLAARGGPLFARATATDSFLQTRDGDTLAVLLDGGFRGGLTLVEGTQLTLGVLVGAPLSGVSLSDGARDVVNFGGLSVRGEVGVEVWL
jgi:hypothetical protein